MTGPVATPTPSQVEKYLEKWRAQGNESSDSALRLLFKTMPKNVDPGQVAVKVAALNGLYATSIYGVVQMAHHIVELDIDDALAAEVADPQLVEKIAHLTLQAKTRRHYSFATKYCSFHRPDRYPIYDSLVVEVLNALLNQGEEFDTFAPGEHWRADYGVYCRSIEGLRSHFGLEDLSIRDIDKYLWMLAKERRGSGA